MSGSTGTGNPPAAFPPVTASQAVQPYASALVPVQICCKDSGTMPKNHGSRSPFTFFRRCHILGLPRGLSCIIVHCLFAFQCCYALLHDVTCLCLPVLALFHNSCWVLLNLKNGLVRLIHGSTRTDCLVESGAVSSVTLRYEIIHFAPDNLDRDVPKEIRCNFESIGLSPAPGNAPEISGKSPRRKPCWEASGKRTFLRNCSEEGKVFAQTLLRQMSRTPGWPDGTR